MSISETPQTMVVDVAFALTGDELPLDHGYLLYAAVVGHIHRLRDEHAWGIHRVRGYRKGHQTLGLRDHGSRLPASRLVMRVPADAIGEVLSLAGRKLVVGRHPLLVGVPEVRPLTLAPILSCPFVTIKGFHEDAGQFAPALERQLTALGILDPTYEVGRRRVMRVRNHTIVGFATTLSNLSPDASMAVQTIGIGGRRKMGAGIFSPGSHGES